MKKIYLFIYLFIASVITDAQVTASWLPLTSGITTNLNGVSAPSSSVCYVCGNAGVIRKTTDGGITWAGQASGTTNTLVAIWFNSLSNGFAIGDNGAAVKTTDGGANWTPITLGTTEHLRGLYFYNANLGFIGGGNSASNGILYRTTDGGNTWSSVSTAGASTGTIYSIFFTSSTVGFANDFDNNVLKTTNGGTSWTSIPGGGSGPLTGNMFFTSSANGFICGQGGTIRKTVDGGATWTGVTGIATTDIYNGIDFYDASNGFIAAGNSASTAGSILSTTNGGASWSTYTPGTSRLCDVDMVNANTGYAVGFGGTILKYNSNVGISETENVSAFQNYPNPFSDFTTIDCGNYNFKNAASAEIYDITGKKVKTIIATVNGNAIMVDRKGLMAGVYFYRVYDGNQNIGSGKIVVEK